MWNSGCEMSATFPQMLVIPEWIENSGEKQFHNLHNDDTNTEMLKCLINWPLSSILQLPTRWNSNNE